MSGVNYILVKEQDHSQSVVLLFEKGEQAAHVLTCFVRVKNEGPHSILFPRTIKYKKDWFRLLKYSEKQDVLFYKLVEG